MVDVETQLSRKPETGLPFGMEEESIDGQVFACGEYDALKLPTTAFQRDDALLPQGNTAGGEPAPLGEPKLPGPITDQTQARRPSCQL